MFILNNIIFTENVDIDNILENIKTFNLYELLKEFFHKFSKEDIIKMLDRVNDLNAIDLAVAVKCNTVEEAILSMEEMSLDTRYLKWLHSQIGKISRKVNEAQNFMNISFEEYSEKFSRSMENWEKFKNDNKAIFDKLIKSVPPLLSALYELEEKADFEKLEYKGCGWGELSFRKIDDSKAIAVSGILL